MLQPEAEPSVTFTEAGVCHFANWHNVSVGVWVGRATLEAARGLFSVGGQMTRAFPSGHSSVAFVRDKVSAPPPQVEELIKRSFGLGSDLTCLAIVLEGSGLWATSLRNMLEKMHQTGRGSVRLQIATSMDDMLGWFLDRHARSTGARFEPGPFRVAMQHMREEGARLALQARA